MGRLWVGYGYVRGVLWVGYGMVGMVWYSMEWLWYSRYGMVWYGMVRYIAYGKISTLILYIIVLLKLK